MGETSFSDDGLQLAELDHRVRNMLQMVASLLNVQARRAPDRRAAEALLAAEAQILAFAILSEALARSGGPETVCAARYLRGLAAHLDAACLAPRGIGLRTETPETLPLGERSAQALGLIVVECVVNAVKHAFEACPDPRITLSLEARGSCDGARCTIADNGCGVPADIAPGKGLAFVRALAARAGGRCEATSGPDGVRITVTLR